MALEKNKCIDCDGTGFTDEKGPGFPYDCPRCGGNGKKPKTTAPPVVPLVVRDVKNERIAPQPPPLRNPFPAVWDLVIQDMKDRDQQGREKYSVPLQPFNGRDCLFDAYQEALDLAVYLRQAILERDFGKNPDPPVEKPEAVEKKEEGQISKDPESPRYRLIDVKEEASAVQEAEAASFIEGVLSGEIESLPLCMLVGISHKNAVSKGFYRGKPFNQKTETFELSTDEILSRLALVHSEVSEALEVIRLPGKTPLDFWTSEKGKPEGFGSELADILIRVADLCGALGIDLEAETVEKIRYNASREKMHGKKA